MNAALVGLGVTGLGTRDSGLGKTPGLGTRDSGLATDGTLAFSGLPAPIGAGMLLRSDADGFSESRYQPKPQTYTVPQS